MYPLTLPGTYNARALGTHPAAPWLVRSAALDALTLEGEQQLRDLGVTLVLDLREPSEVVPPAHGIPVHARPLYLSAPPASGTLEQAYDWLIRDRGAELTDAVRVIAEQPGVVSVHCAAGKDRTALVVALASLAAGVTRDAVIADYVSTGGSVRAARSALVRTSLDALGLSGEERSQAERLHLDSPEEAIVFALDLIDALGGHQEYLQSRGLSVAHFAALAQRTPAHPQPELQPQSPVQAQAQPQPQAGAATGSRA